MPKPITKDFRFEMLIKKTALGWWVLGAVLLAFILWRESDRLAYLLKRETFDSVWEFLFLLLLPVFNISLLSIGFLRPVHNQFVFDEQGITVRRRWSGKTFCCSWNEIEVLKCRSKKVLLRLCGETASLSAVHYNRKKWIRFYKTMRRMLPEQFVRKKYPRLEASLQYIVRNPRRFVFGNHQEQVGDWERF